MDIDELKSDLDFFTRREIELNSEIRIAEDLLKAAKQALGDGALRLDRAKHERSVNIPDFEIELRTLRENVTTCTNDLLSLRDLADANKRAIALARSKFNAAVEKLDSSKRVHALDKAAKSLEPTKQEVMQAMARFCVYTAKLKGVSCGMVDPLSLFQRVLSDDRGLWENILQSAIDGLANEAAFRAAGLLTDEVV